MGRQRKYFTEDERKAARKAYDAAYYSEHKEERAAYNTAHPEYHLLKHYRNTDKKHHRDNDLTPEFVRDMIYKPCHYCGSMAEVGYNGLDRKDSSLGHLQSNCVPCCPTCNKKKRTKDYEVFMKEIQDNV